MTIVLEKGFRRVCVHTIETDVIVSDTAKFDRISPKKLITKKLLKYIP